LYILKIIGKIIEKSQNNKIENIGGFLFFESTLKTIFDIDYCDTLFEILTNTINYSLTSSISSKLETLSIKNYGLFSTIFNLIYTHKDLRETVLNYIMVLLKNAENRKYFIDQKGWQVWFLKNISIEQSEEKNSFVIVDEMDKEELKNKKQDEFFNNFMKEEKYVKIYNLVVNILNLLVLESMLAKDGWKKYRDLLLIIEIFEKNREIEKNKIYTDIFNKMIPKLSNLTQKINKEKDEYFWKNLFHFIRMLEEFSYSISPKDEYYEENLKILVKLMMGLDTLIINTIYNPKTMVIFHTQYDDRDSNILKTIFDIASNQLNNLNITNFKKTMPNLTIFYLLFNIQIFLLKILDEKTIVLGKHNIRLLALLSMDLNHDLGILFLIK
jgi:hypothetical protein